MSKYLKQRKEHYIPDDEFYEPDENGWNVVHEMDDENHSPNLWARKVDDGLFWYIEKEDEKEFCVYDPYEVNLAYPVFTCKSLAYAKDWVNNKIEEELLESL